MTATPRSLDSQLRPELLAAVERALRAAAERALRSGEPVTATHSLELEAAPDLLQVLAHAEQRGEPLFYAGRPAVDLELLCIGAARSCDLHSGDAGALRAATAGWLQPDAGELAGPRIVCALAFEPRASTQRDPHWSAFPSASAVLPELCIELRGGRAQLSLAATLDARSPIDAQLRQRMARFETLLAKADLSPSRAARALTASHAQTDDSAYRQALDTALQAIERGETRKVVLARCEERVLPAALALPETLRALRDAHPQCLTFAHGRAGSTFLGATPERLVRRAGRSVEAWAVAATTGHGRSAQERIGLARDLRDSAKQQTEHALVVDAIEEALRPLCSALQRPAHPELLETGTVQHLQTSVRGELAQDTHVLDLVAALHPTPALAGVPRTAALELIRRCEDLDRGWYAGPLGWLDARGGGEFFIALRCALVQGARARLFAGSGLVAGSTVAQEAAETALKLRSVAEALRTR